MVEIGIPVYKARNTLPKALDSLVAQTTTKPFIVCLSIDGDEDRYEDIIQTYTDRGLYIRVIYSEENGGPGVARQKVLDTTQCDFLMFLDADDMLMPRAIEVLANGIQHSNFDVLRSSFLKEDKNGNGTHIPQNVGTITWFHGKIYRVKFLKEKGLKFHPTLRSEEDAYFNLLCWNSTENRGEVAESTYIWRYNPNSITRAGEDDQTYFKNTYLNYIFSQVEAIKRMPEVMPSISSSLLAQTFVNMYNHYMQAKYYKLSLVEMDEMIGSLSDLPFIKGFIANGENWIEILNYVKPGAVFDNKYVAFYNEPINKWVERIIGKE